MNIFTEIFGEISHHCFKSLIQFDRIHRERISRGISTTNARYSDITFIANLQEPRKIPSYFLFSFYVMAFLDMPQLPIYLPQLPTDSSSRAAYAHTRVYIYTHVCTHIRNPALNASAAIRIGNCAVCTAVATSNTSR